MAKYHITANEMRRCAVAAVVALGTSVAAVTANERPGESLRVAAGIRVILPRDSETPLRLAPDADPSRDAAVQEGIPIGGFQPFVAITLTDKHQWGEFVWAHVLSDGFIGNSLNPPASSHYVIGLLDTGGRLSLVGYCDRAELGFTGSWLTGNQQPVGGVGGEVFVDVGDAMGFFVAGLQAIDETTLALDTTALTGHWHVSVVGLPEEVCGDEVDIPSAVGTPLLAFRDIVIRNDRIRTIQRNGVMYQGPEVEIYPMGDPRVPTYCNQIPLDVRPLGLTTAAYYPNLGDLDFETPYFPTGLAMLEGAPPTGGWFVAGVSVQEGTSGEYTREFVVDTGAQISLIRTFLAGQLGLNVNNPDFPVQVVGVTGEVTVAPGFYLDTLKISAFTGTMVFHDVPVVVLDIDVPGEGIVEGIV
ncbi:MAG: retropepsin-like domain-containing protein, partial [Phycisphaerae bacterium]|nr:retropepsin-like domain-containing protein [Phycisphaerae bacterium]